MIIKFNKCLLGSHWVSEIVLGAGDIKQDLALVAPEVGK